MFRWLLSVLQLITPPRLGALSPVYLETICHCSRQYRNALCHKSYQISSNTSHWFGRHASGNILYCYYKDACITTFDPLAILFQILQSSAHAEVQLRSPFESFLLRTLISSPSTIGFSENITRSLSHALFFGKFASEDSEIVQPQHTPQVSVCSVYVKPVTVHVSAPKS